ncbi:MAG TPA: dTMP kinase [candidate division Zixibacteria bacterium]|nr:dTMP kinase [candidate division Zixibacteria bacterium]
MIRFITLEGGDGTGKSTQLRLLEGYLTGRGKICLATREPGGTALGRLLRRLLLETGEQPLAPKTELFFYLADRAQHVYEVIGPALESGKVVLCDRYTDSTLAYQGYGRGIDVGALKQLNAMASGGLSADLTLLFDCPVEISLARTLQRQSSAPGEDRFERERLEFHARVRDGFLQLARAEPHRIVVVDASRSIEEVFADVRRIVDEKYGWA